MKVILGVAVLFLFSLSYSSVAGCRRPFCLGHYDFRIVKDERSRNGAMPPNGAWDYLDMTM
jgi:hypothetical protein